MTIDRRTRRPPRWAEALLRLLLRPEDRESVSGDLLEAYRDAILPARGKAADRWYVRQVAWYLLREVWVPGVLVGGALLIRYLYDALVPDTIYIVRSRIMSNTISATCLLAALRMSFRTQSLRSRSPDSRYTTPSCSANQISIRCGLPEIRPVVVR